MPPTIEAALVREKFASCGLPVHVHQSVHCTSRSCYEVAQQPAAAWPDAATEVSPLAQTSLPLTPQCCRKAEPVPAVLHMAAGGGQRSLVELLLKHGASSTALTSSKFQRWTPLHKAAKAGAVATAELLLDLGTSVGAAPVQCRHCHRWGLSAACCGGFNRGTLCRLAALQAASRTSGADAAC